MVVLRVVTLEILERHDIIHSMDYFIGFIIGYCCKEIYNLIKYMSTSETIFLDEDWDMMSRDDLP